MAGVATRASFLCVAESRPIVSPAGRDAQGPGPSKKSGLLNKQNSRPVRRSVKEDSSSIKRPQNAHLPDSKTSGTLRELLSEVSRINQELPERISRVEALSALRAIENALQASTLMGHAEVAYVAEVLGHVMTNSPVKPIDPDGGLKALNLLTEAVAERVPHLTTSQVCMLVWVYGCFGPTALHPTYSSDGRGVVLQLCVHAESALIDSVTDALRLLTGLRKLKLRGQSNVTYMTLLRLGPLLRDMKDLNVSELASLVLVSGKLRVAKGNQFVRLAARLVKSRFGEFTDIALCEFVEGFAAHDFKMKPTVFDVFIVEVHRRIQSMKAQHLIGIILNLSKITYLPRERFLSDVCSSVAPRLPSLYASDIAACAMAMGQLDYYSKELMDAAIEQFCRRVGSFDMIQITHVLLGCSRVNALTKELLMTGLKAVSMQTHDGMYKTHRQFLHQVLTHAKLFLQIESIPSSVFPEAWQKACREEWRSDQIRPAYREDGSMLATAELLGLKVEHGASEIGDITVTFVRSPDGQRRVVLDSIKQKSHCFMNNQNLLLPWKQWQYRVLEAQGYEVLSMSDAMWLQLPERSKLRHLGMKLKFWEDEEIFALERKLGIRFDHDLQRETDLV